MRLNRRHLLLGAALLVLEPRRGFAAAAEPAERLLALLPDREAAAALGSAWIAREPGPAPDVVESLRLRLGDPAPAGLRAAMAAATAEDFRSGAVVEVAGWRIARTQAELCALAYFAKTGRLRTALRPRPSR